MGPSTGNGAKNRFSVQWIGLRFFLFSSGCIFGFMFSGFIQGKRKKGGKASKWHANLRERWHKNPCCHWCGCETVINNRLDNGSQKDNAATLDHLFSNLDLRRLLKGGNKLVLACYKCNQRRNNAENRLVYSNNFDLRNNRIDLVGLLKHPESLPSAPMKRIRVDNFQQL